jgi:hypothetical protein
VFEQSGVERCTLRIRITVMTQPIAKLSVGVSFIFQRNGSHDQPAVKEFIPPTFDEIRVIKLLALQPLSPCRCSSAGQLRVRVSFITAQA